MAKHIATILVEYLPDEDLFIARAPLLPHMQGVGSNCSKALLALTDLMTYYKQYMGTRLIANFHNQLQGIDLEACHDKEGE